MIRTFLAVGAIIGGLTVVVAQSDPIAARRQHMKDLGALTKTGIEMAKGEIPYDHAKAQAILAAYVEKGPKIPDLFPETAKTGGDTAALPGIWENKADFKAKADKLTADAKAAQLTVKDADTFKAVFNDLTKDCGACHQTYRAKKS
jgi:cytochrome c556